MNKHSIFLVLIIIWSCESNRRINNDYDYTILIEKENFTVPKDSLESPRYLLSFSIFSKTGLKNISLKPLDNSFKLLYEKKINFNESINKLQAIKYKNNEIPFVVIENENKQYKYFFNYRRFNSPQIIKTHIGHVYVTAPIRSIDFIDKIPSNIVKNKKNKLNYLGSINIYQYDLKINPTDKKIRLHYISNGHIITSNWIDISEKTERLDKLFEY
ncbi:MAG: hypothetical protein KDC67_07900 [Ignavibacteriae bacterium]|nr:hypothetical protein [Ignavibacteriota bacterium]